MNTDRFLVLCLLGLCIVFVIYSVWADIERGNLEKALEITSQTLYDRTVELRWAEEMAHYWRNGGTWGKDGQHSEMMEMEKSI